MADDILFEIEFYQNESGKSYFIDWLEGLDLKDQARIRHRLTRLEKGNFGDHSSVGDGVQELRFFFGPGYRIYFGREKNKLILLLNGGDKSSQSKDIKKAKEYWNNFLRGKK
ncbi:MAG: type II toxin-antitoxin system RelE/ParE family toxin [Deltaproteobacteria bacterium]|nr:type II toxin-antitoxin system RelE/ParE family toxin [Deltaproteobacteria bacterium]